ncbi:YjiH family protein [Glutamicibacter halophytocola]|uniref:YjiH family protein n=1 Tax=Glutamicibacter halophytocola TaxID=1933880 RepID=A0AA94XZE4_9MICC|nr:YjiH family protein [Glutamicibacter halophytocola]ALG28360.1 histidine transporter [Glutamicibacter halophytocola]UUX59813.1 YjiH family protein [Glutamicibacter halophytocola]
MPSTVETREPTKPWDVLRFVLYSGVGIAVFFVPVTLNGKSTIALDHIVSWVREAIGAGVPYYILALLAAGTIMPFATGGWRTSPLRGVFAFANVVGLAVGAGLVFGFGPAWLMEKDMGPFLLNSLVVPVGLIVPIGAIFLAMLVSYGLMEFIGVFCQPIMKPLWRTPGRSAVDAVASFVGSYSLGLLLTDRMYRSGRYTGREAAIIATGFSTVSASFMVIVAKALDLMEHWSTYFWLALVVTFAVTAISVRIPPLSRIPDDTYQNIEHIPEEKVTGNRFAKAFGEAMLALHRAPGLWRNIGENILDGLKMAMAILPSILSIGLLGLVLARFTPVFTWLGYLFAPFAWVVGLDDPLLAGKASATGIAEMFLPATLAAGHESLELRMVIAIICVSAIIFFSALVPCILATSIPVKLWQMVVIWFQRVALSILIATPLVNLVL